MKTKEWSVSKAWWMAREVQAQRQPGSEVPGTGSAHRPCTQHAPCHTCSDLCYSRVQRPASWSRLRSFSCATLAGESESSGAGRVVGCISLRERGLSCGARERRREVARMEDAGGRRASTGADGAAHTRRPRRSPALCVGARCESQGAKARCDDQGAEQRGGVGRLSADVRWVRAVGYGTAGWMEREEKGERREVRGVRSEE